MKQEHQLIGSLDQELEFPFVISKLHRDAVAFYRERVEPYMEGIWINYEGYMKACIIRGEMGDTGLLLVRFPSGGLEDYGLHSHDFSHRQILVLEGSGTFYKDGIYTPSLFLKIETAKMNKTEGPILYSDSDIGKYALEPGSLVQFPKRRIHNFAAGNEGMLVLSVHRPFIPLDDPRAFTAYPQLQYVSSHQ